MVSLKKKRWFVLMALALAIVLVTAIVSMGSGGLDLRESEHLSKDIEYSFTWIEDGQIKNLEYSQLSLMPGGLFVNKNLDKTHEFNELALKFQESVGSIRFLSITATLTFFDGLLIEMVYSAGKIGGEGSMLEVTFTNTLLQDG